MTVVLITNPGGVYDLTVREDGRGAGGASLPPRAVRELLDHLVECEGYEPLAQALEDVDAQESRAEAAETGVNALTRQLAEARTEIEQHKTALDLADQRVRALEGDGDVTATQYRTVRQ